MISENALYYGDSLDILRGSRISSHVRWSMVTTTRGER